jgi:hypothetical protein
MKIVGKSPLEADLRSMAAHGCSSRHLRRFRKKKLRPKKEHGQNLFFFGLLLVSYAIVYSSFLLIAIRLIRLPSELQLVQPRCFALAGRRSFPAGCGRSEIAIRTRQRGTPTGLLAFS